MVITVYLTIYARIGYSQKLDMIFNLDTLAIKEEHINFMKNPKGDEYAMTFTPTQITIENKPQIFDALKQKRKAYSKVYK